MQNPFETEWTGPFQLPPFHEIRDEHFGPAVTAALADTRARIAAIAGDPAPPTFDNTIAALELADQALNRVLGVFWNLAGADSNPAREALERTFSPELSRLGSEITMNRALFARIEALWQDREALGLEPQALRVLTLVHRNFLRAGAGLEPAAQEQLKAVTERLAVLGTGFSQNVLADERAWSMPLAEADLDGLPEFVCAAARAAGEERQAGGPVITLSRSLIVPFLQFSPRRDLRQRAWAAWTARGAGGGATDNRALVAETLALRHQRAALLGHASFADWKLETEMARTPAAVEALLMQVWQPARAQALADAAALQAMLVADGLAPPLQPWDWRYYSEKRRKQLHDLDEAVLKPYLQLDRMIGAAFDCARRLFGLEVRALDLPVYHPDARAWEVLRNGQHLAVFIGDYFNRPSKRSGAWCSAFREQQRLAGDIRPVVVNVCNFARPSDGQPALLSYDDARTLFHEFGHALHLMLSDVTYPSIAGTNVARDFVELPSQLFEHWLEVPEVLSQWATHAQTGQPMPRGLLDRLLGARTWDMGFQTVEYVASALVDLTFHREAPPADPMQRQAEVLDRIGMPEAIVLRHATPHFAHAFAGDGYSSGYYSYMWSEVMDADAFAAFEEAGDPFDPATAERLERFILKAGGSDEAERLYTGFRGRMPGVEAMLKGRGLTAGPR